MDALVMRAVFIAMLTLTFVSGAGAVGFEQLVIFKGGNGANPYAGLVEGSDGNFYGTTYAGGANGYGTVFKMTPTGTLTTLVSFNYVNGRRPQAALVQGSDGNFYGTTAEGGVNGYGTVFRITSTGTLTTLVSFGSSAESFPNGLIQATDGDFYGTTIGDTGFSGTVFKITPSGMLTHLLSFNYAYGVNPRCALVQGSDGYFYGTAPFGGNASDSGTVFKIKSGLLTRLVAFNGGETPYGALVEGSNGDFYGTTYSGGASGFGMVFQMTPTGGATPLVSFNSTNGSYPFSGLTRASDGNFYGTTSSGGANGFGTMFKMTPTGTLTTLVSFNSGHGRPYAGLIQAKDGSFYGTTYSGGGTNTGGIVYRWVVGPLPAPTGLTATALAPNIVNLNWRKTSTDITGFTISRGMFSGGPFTALMNVGATATNYVDRKVHSDLTYYYVVKAYNSEQTSMNSPPAGIRLPIGLTDNLTFQNTSGQFSLWVMNQTNFVRYGSLTNGPAANTGWGVAALADLNNDFNADILWQNSNGSMMTWLMRGTNFLKSASLKNGYTAGSGWKIVGAPDLTGDGKPDILWHHTKGTNMYWRMNGTNFVGQFTLRPGGAASGGWNAIGAADLDGNSSADFIFSNTNGTMIAWLMNQTNYVTAVPLHFGHSSTSGWKFSAFTDLNADHKTDFIWEKNDGRLEAWLMNGTNYLRTVTLRTNAGASAGWKLVGPK